MNYVSGEFNHPYTPLSVTLLCNLALLTGSQFVNEIVIYKGTDILFSKNELLIGTEEFTKHTAAVTWKGSLNMKRWGFAGVFIKHLLGHYFDSQVNTYRAVTSE